MDHQMAERLVNIPSSPGVVLFDMDGVLFDTMPTHADTWYATSKQYGIDAEKDEFYLYEGQKGIDTINHIYQRTFGRLPEHSLAEEIYDHKSTLFAERIQLAPIPGVGELMEYLYTSGAQMGVVTGSAQKSSLDRITRYYAKYIDPSHIVSADSVRRGKPHPDPYLKGMELFGSSPEDTIVIENAPYGVQSASQAGCFTIAVMTGPIPEETLRDSGAALVVPDMKSLLQWFQSTYPQD